MNLEERVEKLEKTIDILKYTIKDILIQLKDGNTNSTNTDNNLIPKDRVLIQSLLERAKDEFHIKFLSNISNTKYDTLTPKQHKVLINIQNNL
tara:strand:- start:1107 stop:1385 length:279 start_codon:yes stop_codon:yes gene_type:complete